MSTPESKSPSPPADAGGSPLAGSPQRTSSPGRGALVGALVGMAARFTVAVSFCFYVHFWGGPWWRGKELAYLFVIASAVTGFVVGAIAGLGCRPLFGAILGAILSGGACFISIVLPAEVAISFSHDAPHLRERLEAIVGLVGMTLAGALAGWAGGAVGRHGRRVE